MKKKENGALKILKSLISEVAPQPMRPSDRWEDHTEEDPWDDKTVNIRNDVEHGEQQRKQSEAGVSDAAKQASSLYRSQETRQWEQILITNASGFWVVEPTPDGGMQAQHLTVVRQGRPFQFTSDKQLDDFEEQFHLKQQPWPGNIVMSKKKVV